MKKLMTVLLAMGLAMSVSAMASDKDKKEVKVTGIITDPMCAKSGDKAKMADADCAKKCAKDGKYALVNDADGSVWAIENGDAVKGHEGHHVTVSGHPNADAKSIHIMKVEMAKEEKKKKS